MQGPRAVPHRAHRVERAGDRTATRGHGDALDLATLGGDRDPGARFDVLAAVTRRDRQVGGWRGGRCLHLRRGLAGAGAGARARARARGDEHAPSARDRRDRQPGSPAPPAGPNPGPVPAGGKTVTSAVTVPHCRPPTADPWIHRAAPGAGAFPPRGSSVRSGRGGRAPVLTGVPGADSLPGEAPIMETDRARRWLPSNSISTWRS